MPERPLDRRFFAVGTELAANAEESVLLCPGILRSDQRIAKRPLSSAELSDLRLKDGAVRLTAGSRVRQTALEADFNHSPPI